MCGAELRTELCNFCHYGLWRETACRDWREILQINPLMATCHWIKTD